MYASRDPVAATIGVTAISDAGSVVRLGFDLSDDLSAAGVNDLKVMSACWRTDAGQD